MLKNNKEEADSQIDTSANAIDLVNEKSFGDDPGNSKKEIIEECEANAKKRFSFSYSKQDWLNNFSVNFSSIVVDGMEASLRSKVAKSIKEDVQLKGRENQAVVNSVNHHIFQFKGSQRPDKDLCRYCIFIQSD